MDNSIDQQFVEYVVKSLVGNPDAVKVERSVDEKGVLLELTVDPEDLGRVIGKRGATAQSLRTLLRALGTKNEARYNLKIVDNGEPRPERDNAATAPAATATDDSRQTTVQDNALPEDDAVSLRDETPENDVVSKTRKELEDLDDLDI
ncbi:hypothetical protein BH09PAT4_BH09PAT4_00560 [soil metagenome]